MKLVGVMAVLVLTLSAHEAWPCSISTEPSATVFGPTTTPVRGRRPWIRLFNVKPTDKITLGLAPPCGPRNSDCTVKPLAFDRAGAFLRPKAPLPPRGQIWVQLGTRTLETFAVTSADPKALPAWNGMTKPALTSGREGLCAPSGPVVSMKVTPTQADLSDAVLLVYTKPPVAKRPHEHLGAIYLLGVGELELRNGLGNIWMAKRPAKLWTAISDGDGNVGPIVEHSFDMRADVLGPKNRAEPRGTRPWIRLSGAPKSVAIQTVDAACDPSAVCTATMTSAVERGGDFVRPKNPLPQGARVQVVSNKSVLVDFTVRTGPGKTLPAIPFTLGAPAGSSPASCPTPNMVAPDLSQFDTEATVILVYASPPDPAKPLAKLTTVLQFEGRWLDFGAPGSCVFKKLPTKLWTILATDDGAIGAPVEHDLSPAKPGAGGI
ncbi:MAG: hypothetical protein ACKV2T_11240 [Kofleriaceae bacterium]